MSTWILALALVDGVGPVSFQRIVEVMGSPQKALEASEKELAGIPGLKKKAIQDITSGAWEKRLEATIEAMEKFSISLVTLQGDRYPSMLKALPHPPPVLFYRGNLEVLKAPCITVVGTRTPSHYGKDMAHKLALGLAKEGFTVVSGLARGIDTAAHRGALKGGKTVAVVGTGLDRVYPPENVPLAREIVEKDGALISLFPPGTPPDRGNFPRRNFIMAALARGVVVIEAGKKSGAVITAHHARDLGRPVMGLPGLAGASHTSGVHSLIKEGAHLIENLRDILEILGSRVHDVQVQGQGEPPPLTPQEEDVWNILAGGPLPPEIIAEKCHMTLQDIYTLLLTMEMKGLVARRRGNTYERRAQ